MITVDQLYEFDYDYISIENMLNCDKYTLIWHNGGELADKSKRDLLMITVSNDYSSNIIYTLYIAGQLEFCRCDQESIEDINLLVDIYRQIRHHGKVSY